MNMLTVAQKNVLRDRLYWQYENTHMKLTWLRHTGEGSSIKAYYLDGQLDGILTAMEELTHYTDWSTLYD